jgi:hypothetical protein
MFCLAARTQRLLLRRDRRRRQEQCSNQREFLHVRQGTAEDALRAPRPT